jgi:hypothetical protein
MMMMGSLSAATQGLPFVDVSRGPGSLAVLGPAFSAAVNTAVLDASVDGSQVVAAARACPPFVTSSGPMFPRQCVDTAMDSANAAFICTRQCDVFHPTSAAAADCRSVCYPAAAVPTLQACGTGCAEAGPSTLPCLAACGGFCLSEPLPREVAYGGPMRYGPTLL